MGVAPRIVQQLRDLGHDAIHLREQGLQRLPDPEVFRKAVTEQRVLLTFDLDFGEILAQSTGKTVSVILFRLQNTRTLTVWRRLQDTLAAASADLASGAVVVVEDGRIRVRIVPF